MQETLQRGKGVGCCSIIRRCESARRRAIAIKNVRVWVPLLVLATRRVGGVYGKALSKYQFETAAGIGMRHAFHRPLRPAFHFYLYLPGTSLLSALARPVSPGHPERGRKEAAATRRCASSIFYDILFPIRGKETLGHHAASRTLFDFYGFKS